MLRGSLHVSKYPLIQVQRGGLVFLVITAGPVELIQEMHAPLLSQSMQL